MVPNFDLSKVEGFKWDEGNLEHLKKHEVDYTECEEIFSNLPLLLNEGTVHSKFEERIQVLGRTNNGRLLFIAVTIRNNKIRVISARDQSKQERNQYKKAGVDGL